MPKQDADIRKRGEMKTLKHQTGNFSLNGCSYLGFGMNGGGELESNTDVDRASGTLSRINSVEGARRYCRLRRYARKPIRTARHNSIRPPITPPAIAPAGEADPAVDIALALGKI